MKKTKPHQFLRIPHSLFNHEGIKGSTIATYAALASYADNKGFCYPSVSSIAGRAGISLATARRECAHLVSLGYLQITPHHVGTRQSSNHYLLKWQSGELSRQENGSQNEQGEVIEFATPTPIENDGRSRIILNKNHLSTATELVERLWSPAGRAQSKKTVITAIETALINGCTQSELSSALLRLNSQAAYISSFSLQKELAPKSSFKGLLQADIPTDWSTQSEDI